MLGTAKDLTEEGVPTPSEWKGTAPAPKRFPGVWSENIVWRILKNPTYIGNLTQKRSRKIGYKVDRKINLPPQEWVTIPSTHEAIIDPAIFAQAQGLLSLRSYQLREGTGHLLTGLVFCVDCGAPRTYVREGALSYMVCQGYRRGGRLGLCTAHSMREDRVVETVRRQLKGLARELGKETLQQAVLRDERTCISQRQLDAALRKLEANKKVAQSLYRDKALSMLTGVKFEELFHAAR